MILCLQRNWNVWGFFPLWALCNILSDFCCQKSHFDPFLKFNNGSTSFSSRQKTKAIFTQATTFLYICCFPIILVISGSIKSIVFLEHLFLGARAQKCKCWPSSFQPYARTSCLTSPKTKVKIFSEAFSSYSLQVWELFMPPVKTCGTDWFCSIQRSCYS